MGVTVKWHGAKVKDDMRRAAAVAVNLAAEYLLEAANRTVPIEEDTLERSGKASVDTQQLVGMVSYDTPYARRQHEDLTYKHADGRRAKWLQRALMEQSDAIIRIVGERLRAAQGGR